ncbi:MAG: hypothetical protein AB7U61_00975 [Methylocystis sp.]
MTKAQDQLPLDEILQRIEIARQGLLPQHLAAMPKEQTWDFLTALLLNDDKIFERVEAIVADKKRGCPKMTAEEAQRSSENLISLADAFDEFEKQLKHSRERQRLPKQPMRKAAAEFAKTAPRKFELFDKEETTIVRLIQTGRRMSKWPRRFINGRSRILHPAQVDAYNALMRAPLDTESATAEAADAILSLLHESKDGLNEIKNLRMHYLLRGHAIRSMFGGPPLPLLDRLAKEIRDE